MPNDPLVDRIVDYWQEDLQQGELLPMEEFTAIMAKVVDDEKRRPADDALAELVRASAFHPDDPPYLKQAWKEYIDSARRDRALQEAKAKAAKRKAGEIRYSWDTELAMRRYWDAVKAARQEGYQAFEKLDTNSPRVSVLPPDDRQDDE